MCPYILCLQKKQLTYKSAETDRIKLKKTTIFRQHPFKSFNCNCNLHD